MFALPAMPTAYFGHSLGAVVALELARAEAAGPPLHLFCAARPWPGAPTGERPDMECLDDDAFIDAMAAQYGSLNEALAEEVFQDAFVEWIRQRARMPNYGAAVAWLSLHHALGWIIEFLALVSLVAHETLIATGLVEPGSLVRWRYALALPDPAADLVAVRARLRDALPEAGFVVADRRDPSPRVTRTIERLSQFLSLVGLTALLVGGVGVANAVSTFIDRRRKVVATLKSIGASNGLVFRIFLIEVMAIAAVGVVIGIALGLTVPYIVTSLYGHVLPIRAEVQIGLGGIAAAAAYGLLVALVFMLWPLGRAERIKPAALFRDEVSEEIGWPRWPVLAMIAACLAALAMLAIFTSDQRRVAIYFLGAVSLVFAVFLLLGGLVTKVARRAPRSRRPELAIAVGNLGAPGGLTRSVILSLGTGLSLLVAIALADASLVEELEAKNAELDSFSYSVAHDLRAPLRSLDGFSLALLEDYAETLDDEGREYLRFIRESAQQMSQLIDDLLALSRVTRSDFQRAPVNLTSIARSVVTRLKQSQPDRNVELVVDDGLAVDGDANLLAIVMENLIGNAWKYSGKRPQARIEIGATSRSGRPAYFVRDNGAGFDMAYASKLFGVFQRLHSTREFEGTGIGLATVQRIIRRHGGQVWADGAVDHGATFYFTLSGNRSPMAMEQTDA